jgi:hypothetical protein
MHLTMELQVWCPMYFASVVICDLESVCSGFFGVVPFVMFFCVKDTRIQDSSVWAWVVGHRSLCAKWQEATPVGSSNHYLCSNSVTCVAVLLCTGHQVIREAQNSERLNRRRALVTGISICEMGCQVTV